MPTIVEASSSSDGAIRVSGISKRFGSDVVALDDLTLDCSFGSITAIIGANGSGKSTLLKVLLGQTTVDSGVVEVLGFNPLTDSRRLRYDVGYVSQQQALDSEMTGREMLDYFSALYGLTGAQRRERIDSVVLEFELTEVLNRRIDKYSGGFRQRLHVAVAMLPQPAAILLDEPSTGLDERSKAKLWNSLRTAAGRGCAVIVVTHDFNEVTKNADRVAMLHRGKLLAVAAPDEIVRQSARESIEIHLASSPADLNAFGEELKALPCVESVDARTNLLWIRFHSPSDSDVGVYQVLKSHDLVVVRSSREAAGLSGAYRHMAGQVLTPAERKDGGRRRSRRHP